MTPQEYISSGILELYALGSVSPAEMQEVETMALKNPEVKKALDEILSDIESYATLHAVEPDTVVREKVLQAISSGKTESKKAEKEISSNGKVIALPPSAPSRFRGWAIAASVLLLISIGLNIFYMNSMSQKEAQLASASDAKNNLLSDSLKQLADAKAKTESQRDSILYVLDFLRSPMTQSIALNSQINDHPMKAVVHWDMKTMKVAVDPMTLPATTENQKYVLWAIVDGKPVNEGGFDVNSNTGIQMMNTVPKADSFAISLEKTGNVATPAGPIYVAGKPVPTQP
jgi:anti-sigma-K factor RskA